MITKWQDLGVKIMWLSVELMSWVLKKMVTFRKVIKDIIFSKNKLKIQVNILIVFFKAQRVLMFYLQMKQNNNSNKICFLSGIVTGLEGKPSSMRVG